MRRRLAQQKAKAEASMAAFDGLPEAFRRFIVEHPRTTTGQQFAQLLARHDGDVEWAIEAVRRQMPAPPPLVPLRARPIRRLRTPTATAVPPHRPASRAVSEEAQIAP
jgi:hypothetical protein